jgi:cytochrome P450 family 138
MEMDVVLRTMLREFELVTTTAPSEKWRSRGIAYAPADGGRAVMRRVGRTAAGDEGRPAQALAAAA